MELKDRVSVVTGGNKGIGKAIALKLAGQGCHLALIARDLKSLKAPVK
ncbi:MAG: SDR family NAD(P)-dependent oxidoreductase [Caldisericaceae bacterium]|nr:SDR family NAD(P)-dependent oxidoreductase [Caldisericaceae bacterium]